MCEKTNDQASKEVMVSKAILTFLTGVRPIDNKEVALRRAFDNAYRDMATHTLKYNGTPSDAAKKELKDDIFKQIKNRFDVSEMKENFDEWHKSFCQYIVKCVGNSELLWQIDRSLIVDNVFTYGQAQKLVNMMLKYLYVYDKCNGGDTYDGVIQFFHVPLDSKVFSEIYRICTKNGGDAQGFSREKYMDKPWSKINDYGVYMACQNTIRGLFENHIIKGSDSPFEWELANWPF